MALRLAGAYDADMATYTLRLYTKQTGTSVQVGDGALDFDVGDDAAAIRYAQTSLAEAIREHSHVLLFQGDRVVWEKDGDA